MTLNKTRPDHEPLRPHLEAEAGMWTPPINRLLEELSTDNIHTEYGRFAVLDAVYEHIGKYAPYPDTTREDYSPTNKRLDYSGNSVSFEFSLNTRDRRTYWMSAVDSIDVIYGKDWNPKCNLDDDEPEDYTNLNDREPKYMLNGFLIDTIATANPTRAAVHIEKQLAGLSKRIRYLADLERFARVPFEADETNPDDFTDFTSPVNIHGVGEKTEKTYARHYGVPSNITTFNKQKAGQFLSTSWGTRPNRDELWEKVTNATQRYRDFHEQNATATNLTPEDLLEYPKPQANDRANTRRFHHND